MERRSFLQQLVGGSLGLWVPFSPFRSGREWMRRLSRAEEAALWRLIRRSFPLTKDRIYFNTGGLGPSPYPVLEAVEDKRRELEQLSETGHALHDRVRARIAGFIGAEKEEIAFTRNATEGMNFIARGIPLKQGDEVLMTTHEHPGGAMPWLAVARDKGVVIRLFEPQNDPNRMIDAVRTNITSRTRVLMISHVTCTLGTVFPVQDICRLAREQGVITVLDGAQAVGQIPVHVGEIGCDYYTTSGHKWLLGPKETGILYISRQARSHFQPSFVGAYSDSGYDLDKLLLQYRNDAVVNEYGTRDAAKVWGLAAAVDFIEAIGMERVVQRLYDLADRFKARLQEIPRVEILTPFSHASSAGIVTFRVAAMEYREVAKILGAKYRMRVRVVGEHNINAVRVSLHIFNSEKEVDRLAEAIREISGRTSP